MSTGRPKASSRETISEAACELFLEQGYERTAVADIAARAGVSRSSFFNYFESKAAILWAGFDARIDELTKRLDDTGLREAVESIASDFAPDALALAFKNADAMQVGDELERDAGLRQARIAAAISQRLRAQGVGALRADVVGAAHAGAVMAAVRQWAQDGAGRRPLSVRLGDALDIARLTLA